MDAKRKQVCVFCCNTVQNDFESTNEITKKIFQALLLEVNLEKAENRNICGTCIEIAKRCLHFKSVYLNTETIILLFAFNREDISFDIRDVYKENCTTTIDEDLSICRFCMSLLNGNKFVKLDTVMNESVCLMLPEVDWNVIRNPLICTTCESSIQHYLSLVTNSLRTVQKGSNTIRRKETTAKKKHRYDLLFKDILGPPSHYKRPADNQESDNASAVGSSEQVELSEPSGFQEKSELFDNENVPQETAKCEIVPSTASTVKKYTCPWCAFRTGYKSVLEVHILVHDNTKTKKLSDVKTQMVFHEDPSRVDKHQCTFCPYRAKQKCVLARHMLVHKGMSGTEIYQCSFCPYKATLKKNLVSHLAVHKDSADEDKYRCLLCDYKTKRKAGLKKHMSAHEDAKSDV